MNAEQKAVRIIASIALALLIVFMFGMHERARAAGMLVADGGFGGILEIQQHSVDVTVNNRVAVTRVTQVFKNTENRQVEALYTFPVPKGASVSNFSMWINGREMVGEVLQKERARQIYDSYKEKRRDPGLLEQKDYRTFEMRIFPIAAQAEQRVEITYYQELDVDDDQTVYVYPLATSVVKGVDTRTTGRFAFNADIRSEVPIKSLSSPSHGTEFVMAQHSDKYVQASLETQGGSLERDFVLRYALARPRTGVDFIASKQRGEDGYFMLTVTAGEDLKKSDTGMDYVFVLDTSGSMETNGKLGMSERAVEAFVRQLGSQDRFELMSFSVQPEVLFETLTNVTDEALTRSGEFLATRRARGGTNLRPAMQKALRYRTEDRKLNIVILSDGMTEQTERRDLLGTLQKAPSNIRVFCIGVGNDVERPLLQQLAEESGGLAAFISQGDDFKAQAEAFRRKLMHPVASDLRIDFTGITVYDVEPAVMPNLYHGAPVTMYGRYKGSGEGVMRIQGNLMGREFSKNTGFEFPSVEGANPEIERMWALKRVETLEREAKRTGAREETKREIVLLGEEYSIVTEYTSFLVLENDDEYKRWKIERRNQGRHERESRVMEGRRQELEEIRNRAVQGIGPDAKAVETQTNNSVAAPAVPAGNRTVAPSSTSRNIDFGGGSSGGGSGPVGPLFAAGSWWLMRRRKQKDTTSQQERARR